MKLLLRLAAAALLATGATSVAADAVTDWNERATTIVADARLGTPPAIRVMALLQTAVRDAAFAITANGTTRPSEQGQIALQAAVAAANRTALSRLVPAQTAAIESAYATALARLPEGPARATGIQAGETAATAVLARRAEDHVPAESYRPHTTAGAYVPTASPAATQWPTRQPWRMTSASQFRPAPPPTLQSEAWHRAYREVKAVGSKTSAERTPEQTEIAQFWEYSLPSIYYGAVKSVATLPGRNEIRNARLYAAIAQAMDDAMIAVMDAKYHYAFWRPATAIRNGDVDGHPATDRDPAWTPLIEAPMHPEYPSAHSILAGAVGQLLRIEVGNRRVTLSTSSPTAKGASRRWNDIDDFVQEVAASRIYAGIHFRFSTEAGVAMGRRIGTLVAEQQAAVQ